MFCPFIKDTCNLSCVFSSDDFSSCALLETITKIESNTSSDQTESWSINSKLGDISDKLDTIIKKLEQLVD